MKKISIRGIPFDNVTMEDALHFLLSRLTADKQTSVFTPNAEIVQACIEDASLAPIITSAELIVPDGIGVIKASRILGTPLKEKVAGVVLGERLAAALSQEEYRNHTLFLLGGKPGVAKTAAEKLLEKYPGLSIAGYHDGYFDKNGIENDRVLEEIRKSGADVLYVCLGAPAQEKWIAANRDKLPVVLFLGLGGSVDIYAGTAKRAPRLFVSLGLEWFWRLLKEPWRFKRMMKLPKFYFGTWKYKLQQKKHSP